MIGEVLSTKYFLIIYIIASITTISNATDSCKCDNDGLNVKMTCSIKIDIELNDADICIKATQNLMTYISSYIIGESSEIVSTDTFSNLNNYKNLQGYISHLSATKNSWTTLKSSAFKDFKNCLFLDLTGNNIKVIEDGALQDLSLSSLNLSYNGIELLYSKSLATNVYSHLTELNLSHNLLTFISYDVFFQLQYLQYLNLEGNMIFFLERNCFASLNKLINLNLHDNNLNALNETLYPLVSLKKLDLSSNNLSQITSFDLENLKSLELMDISNNTLRKFDLGCYQFRKNGDTIHTPCNSFIFFSHLNSVYLTNNRLPFPETFGLYRFSSLNFFNVSYNYIKNYDLFSKFSLLKTLDISNCNMNTTYKLEFYHGHLTTLITDYKRIVNLPLNEFKYKFANVQYLGLRGTSICCDKINEFIKIGINITLIDLPGNKCYENCVDHVPVQSTTINYAVPTATEQITDKDAYTYNTITDVYEIDNSYNITEITTTTVTTITTLTNKSLENTNFLWILISCFLILVIVLLTFIYIMKNQRQENYRFEVHHINLAAPSAG